MDNFADERDFKILEADKYTFFILARILKRDCELLLTDHSRMIICYSQSPFPVWICATPGTEGSAHPAFTAMILTWCFP